MVFFLSFRAVTFSFKVHNKIGLRSLKIRQYVNPQTQDYKFDDISKMMKVTFATGLITAIGFCGPAFAIGPTEVPLSNLQYKQVHYSR